VISDSIIKSLPNVWLESEVSYNYSRQVWSISQDRIDGLAFPGLKME